MNADVSPFLSLSRVIAALRASLGAWSVRGVLGVAVALLVHRRLGQICSRMERMVARFQAGTLRVGGARGPTVRPRAVSRRAWVRVWPGRFGWLVRAAAWEAAGFGSQVRAVLETPEMVALLTAAPQAARVLTPLCRMLAIETSVLRPGAVAAEPVAVRRQRVPPERPDLGRVPIPPGVMGWVRRDGFARGR